MKKLIFIAAAALLSTGAYAAGPEAIAQAAKACCAGLACCDANNDCCDE